jgi:MFS family permease
MPRRKVLIVTSAAVFTALLDATIVNVALPHILRALGFSGSGLEWVVNAYALTFGGLMLLGGRAGDLLGRRRVFIPGWCSSAPRRWAAGSPPPRLGCWRPAPFKEPAPR